MLRKLTSSGLRRPKTKKYSPLRVR